jgi:hypothetical protein
MKNTPSIMIIALTMFVALTLAPGTHALYYTYSQVVGASCENQVGFVAAVFGSFPTCGDLSYAPHAIYGTEIFNVHKLAGGLCTSDGVVVLKDSGCIEVSRAPTFCISAANDDLVYLISCEDDIVPGSWGTDLIK